MDESRRYLGDEKWLVQALKAVNGDVSCSELTEEFGDESKVVVTVLPTQNP